MLLKILRERIIVGAPARRCAVIFWSSYTMKSDVELTTAHRDLLSLDHAIGKLHDKFGDRADSRADCVEAEERRFAAPECLATIQAGSPAGMVAKAKALKVASVAEDLDRQAAIAASLAGDVLRHFSRAA